MHAQLTPKADHGAPSESGMPHNAPPELTVARALALFKAGRLRELIGASSDASPAEVKAVCKQALLKYHPDKGGDPEMFKIVRPATDMLVTCEELLYVFEGDTPPWARYQLQTITSLRQEISGSEQRLRFARAQLEAATTASTRLRPTRDIASAEATIRNAQADLQFHLDAYRAAYAEHVALEQQRKQRAAAREARVAAERERVRLEKQKNKWLLRKRRQRGVIHHFPTLPLRFTDHTARAEYDRIKYDYTRLLAAIRQRRARGIVIEDLQVKATALLAQAHKHVQACAATAEVNELSLSRFPRTPVGHPYTEQIRKLKAEYTNVRHRIKRAKTEAVLFDLEALQDEIRSTAHDLLAEA